MDWLKTQQICLFAPAPFFSYPPKAVLGAFWASDYDSAFAHFHRDHDDALNLRLHLLCLVLQLATNFALLASVEAAAGWPPALRALTVACWAPALLSAPGCPPAARLASVAALVAAAAAGKRVADRWRPLVFAQGVIVALAVDALVLERPPAPASFAAALAAWTAAAAAAARHRGALAAHKAAVNAAAVAAAVALAGRDDPLRGGLVHCGAFAFWLLATLTDQAWLFFWGFGFVATVTQGVVHEVTKQEATLLQLQGARGSRDAFEWAHVLYFPNLVFHTALVLRS